MSIKKKQKYSQPNEQQQQKQINVKKNTYDGGTWTKERMQKMIQENRQY